MSSFFRGVSVHAALTLLLGIILIIMPGVAAGTLVSLLGWLLLVFGFICLVVSIVLRSGTLEPGPIATGLISLASGLVLLIRPGLMVSLCGIVLGLFLVIHGLQDVKQARQSKAMGYDWKPSAVIAALKLVMGALVIFNPFSTAALLLRMAGIFLIVDALGDLILVRNAARR